MPRLLALIAILLSGGIAQPKHVASSASIAATGTIEKVCFACNEALLASGRGLLWDVLTVRIASPEAFSGAQISVEVLVEGTAPRNRYVQGSKITFSAAKAAIVEHRVMLNAADIHGG